MTDAHPAPASPRTPPPDALYEHLARYLAGRSASGARVPVERRRAMYRTLTHGRPELRSRLDGLIIIQAADEAGVY